MQTFLLVVHILVSIAIIVIVLLQMGKGASVGASFGAGASGAQFGPTGGGSVMGKVTAAAATLFMITSLCLAAIYASPGSDSVMPDQVQVPAQEAAPAPEPAAE